MSGGGITWTTQKYRGSSNSINFRTENGLSNDYILIFHLFSFFCFFEKLKIEILLYYFCNI